MFSLLVFSFVGSGKSSLFRILSGIWSPLSGIRFVIVNIEHLSSSSSSLFIHQAAFISMSFPFLFGTRLKFKFPLSPFCPYLLHFIYITLSFRINIYGTNVVLFNFSTGEVLRFLPFSPKVVFFLPQKSFVTDGTLRQQVTVFNYLKSGIHLVKRFSR